MYLPVQTRNCWATKVFLDTRGTVGCPVTLGNDSRLQMITELRLCGILEKRRGWCGFLTLSSFLTCPSHECQCVSLSVETPVLTCQCMNESQPWPSRVPEEGRAFHACLGLAFCLLFWALLMSSTLGHPKPHHHCFSWRWHVGCFPWAPPCPDFHSQYRTAPVPM